MFYLQCVSNGDTADLRFFGRLVNYIRFRSLTQVTQEFATRLGHLVSKRSVQRSPHGQAIYSCDADKNRTLVSRTGSDDDDGVPEPLTGQYQTFSDESRFNLAYFDARVRVWRTSEKKYIPGCLRMVNRNRIVSVMVWRFIGYHGVGNLIILDENMNADSYIRTLSENLLDSVENIFGDRNYPFVFQHDKAPVHTARRTIVWLEQQYISTIRWPVQSPELNIIQQVWDFMGREIVEFIPITRNYFNWALHNSCLNITVPYLYNLCNSLPYCKSCVINIFQLSISRQM